MQFKYVCLYARNVRMCVCVCNMRLYVWCLHVYMYVRMHACLWACVMCVRMCVLTLNSGLSCMYTSMSSMPASIATAISLLFQNSVINTDHTAIKREKKGITGWEKFKVPTTTHSRANPTMAGPASHEVRWARNSKNRPIFSPKYALIWRNGWPFGVMPRERYGGAEVSDGIDDGV